MSAGESSVTRSKGPVGLRILVVDDYPDAAASLAILLRLWGHEVHVTNSSQHALELATTVRPDIAIVDLRMPSLDGYQLARLLREQQVTAAILLIAVTGLASETDHRRSLEAGFSFHLVKPVEPDKLRAILANLA